MKTFASVAMIGVCALVAGCKTSPQGGGVSNDEGFRINVPSSVDLRQGAVLTVTVTVQRGDRFKRDIKMESRCGKGVDVDPASTVIRASDKPEFQLRLSAAKDAPIGEYTVYVRGTPDTGDPTSVEFKVKVTAP